MGLCLFDCILLTGFSLSNGSQMSELHLFDGFGSLVLILMPDNVGVPHHFSLVRGQDGPGPEQLLQGFCLLPFAVKVLHWACWLDWSLGEIKVGCWRRCWSHLEFFDSACGESKGLSRMVFGWWWMRWGGGGLGDVHCSCCKAPCRFRLRAIAISHGDSTARKGGWHLCKASIFRFCATQYHLYHGGILGGSILADGTPEWQLLKRELMGFGLPV